jgi:hypothetical protein
LFEEDKKTSRLACGVYDTYYLEGEVFDHLAGTPTVEVLLLESHGQNGQRQQQRDAREAVGAPEDDPDGRKHYGQRESSPGYSECEAKDAVQLLVPS